MKQLAIELKMEAATWKNVQGLQWALLNKVTAFEWWCEIFGGSDADTAFNDYALPYRFS